MKSAGTIEYISIKLEKLCQRKICAAQIDVVRINYDGGLFLFLET